MIMNGRDRQEAAAAGTDVSLDFDERAHQPTVDLIPFRLDRDDHPTATLFLVTFGFPAHEPTRTNAQTAHDAQICQEVGLAPDRVDKKGRSTVVRFRFSTNVVIGSHSPNVIFERISDSGMSALPYVLPTYSQPE